MSPEKMLSDAKALVASGGKYLVYTVRRPRAPGNRAALMPGLVGQVAGWDGERATIMVEAAKIVTWFARRPTLLDQYQQRCAERATAAQAAVEDPSAASPRQEP